jgi:hypothetical protein
MPIRVPFEVGFPERKTPFSTQGGQVRAGDCWRWSVSGERRFR